MGKEREMSDNLVSGLHDQICRAKEILPHYEAVPAGAFGAIMIRAAIQQGESALSGGNIEEMIRAHKLLEGIAE